MRFQVFTTESYTEKKETEEMAIKIMIESCTKKGYIEKSGRVRELCHAINRETQQCIDRAV